MRLKQYLGEKRDARDSLYVGAKVKLLQGRNKGKTGKVIDLSVEDDQVDVKVGNKMSYVGFDDVKLIESELNEKGYKCRDCGKKMNPAERMLGPVCKDCVRKKHKEATK